MIGNDIVDLKLAAQESNWRRRGYLGKIFTDAERELIAAARNPDQQVWLLWACKEAAYKAWVTEFGQRCFAPRQLQVVEWEHHEHGHYQAILATRTRTYTLLASATADYVKALTQVAPVELSNRAHLYLPQASLVSARRDVRSAVRQAASKELNCSLADIRLDRNEQGRPLLYYQGKPTDLYLSWSHHGHWAAWCIGRMTNTNTHGYSD